MIYLINHMIYLNNIYRGSYEYYMINYYKPDLNQVIAKSDQQYILKQNKIEQLFLRPISSPRHKSRHSCSHSRLTISL